MMFLFDKTLTGYNNVVYIAGTTAFYAYLFAEIIKSIEKHSIFTKELHSFLYFRKYYASLLCN